MTKTINQSHCNKCGTTTVMQSKGVRRSESLQPVLVEYVGATPDDQKYIGKKTNTAYYGVVSGSIFQLYLADYLADPNNFNQV